MINVMSSQKTYSRILKIEKKGKKPVYDFTVRDVHRINADGFYTSNCHHPDITTFVNIKKDLKKVTGANVSVRFTDEFMQAVKSGGTVQLRFPVEPDVPHVVEEHVDARKLFDEIVTAAWEVAEPGALFWDTVKRLTPTECYIDLGFGSISTNPCGELILSAYDSCRLLLMNLYSFVKDPFTKDARFDLVSFDAMVRKAQRLMDDLIDLELEAIQKIIEKIKSDPEPEDVKRPEIELWTKIHNAAQQGRRTGLGITALGDAIAAVGMKYGTDEAIELTDLIYRQLAVASYESSIDMAVERGPFPIHEYSREEDHPYLNLIRKTISDGHRELWRAHGRRNIANLTTPPAGSTSLETQTTSGFEPTIFISAVRRKKINPSDKGARVDFTDEMGDMWQEYEIVHPKFAEWRRITGLTDPKDSPYWGATAEEIDPVKKVLMQAAAQRWIDHSISNTTNLPTDVSKDVIRDLYITAWESGCKGITVYRKGSREGVIVDKKKSEQPKMMTESQAPKRPKELKCDIHQVVVKGEKWTILIGMLEGRPYEVFGGLSQYVEIPKRHKTGVLVKNGKQNGVSTYNLSIRFGDDEDDRLIFKNIVDMFENPSYGAWTRTLSLALRHGIPIQYIVEQLQKDKHSDMQSFSRVISRVLKDYIKDGTEATIEVTHSRPDGGRCNAKLVYLGGCPTCMICGHAKCG